MGPHGDLGWVMDKLEQPGHSAEVLILFAALELDLKEGVIVAFALGFFDINSCEFLVGGEPRGGHVVGEQVGVGYDVTELDEVAVFDGEVSSAVIGGCSRR